MLPWSLSMSEANTIDIVNIDIINFAAVIIMMGPKCIGGVILVTNYLPTHSGVLDSIERECCGHTSLPCPLW